MNEVNGGARRDRTDDLMLAKHALSKLSYGPSVFCQRQKMRRARDARSGKAARTHKPNNAEGHQIEDLVGRGGLEPPTSRLSGVRSNHLSYRPISEHDGKPSPQVENHLKLVF